jgi:C1A family cysteine protease
MNNYGSVPTPGGGSDLVDSVEVAEERQEGSYLRSASGLVLLSIGVFSVGVIAASGSINQSAKSSTVSVSSLAVLPKTAKVTYSTFSDSDIAGLFDAFKRKYNKSYKDTDEESARFANFKTFLSEVDKRNAAETEATSNVHDITKFADWSKDEFDSKAICATRSRRLSLANRERMLKTASKYTSSADDDDTDDLDDGSDYVNWADKYTTAVKDQGICGSCW